MMEDRELFALRAFVQRGETRLATMHAVAAAFISGAGLLVLFPLFFRDSAAPIFSLVLREFEKDVVFSWPECLLTLWIIPLFFTLAIPIYALKLLIEELVVVYFVPHIQTHDYFLPRFTLTPLSMPLDDPIAEPDLEFSRVKRLVTQETYQRDLLHLAVAPNQNSRDRRSLMNIGDKYPGVLAPSILRQTYRLALGPDGKQNIGWLYDVRSGKAGLSDKSLVAEAARLEVSLVRFSARIRVMALRYFKSLLVLIWTFIILSIFIWLLEYVQDRTSYAQFNHQANLRLKNMVELVCLITGMVWSGFTPAVVNKPLGWIRKFGSLDTVARHGDVDLSHFEGVVLSCCVFSFVAASVGLVYYFCFVFDIERNYLLQKDYFTILATTAVIILLSFASLIISTVRFFR